MFSQLIPFECEVCGTATALPIDTAEPTCICGALLPTEELETVRTFVAKGVGIPLAIACAVSVRQTRERFELEQQKWDIATGRYFV
jgi:hypothetical protein